MESEDDFEGMEYGVVEGGDDLSWVQDDGTEDLLSDSELSEESEAEYTDDESDSDDDAGDPANAELAYTNLTVAKGLKDHPIHGEGMGMQTADGFTVVANYLHPFIRPQDTPVHIWPQNAADWGLIEYLPSQTDMTPKRDGVSHPIVNQNGDEASTLARVNAAFYYKLPGRKRKHKTVPGGPKGRRSCRFTHWSIDPRNGAAILDDCWGCRRLGLECPLKGRRLPRRYRDGEPIGTLARTSYPGYGRPRLPTKDWTPLVRHHQPPGHRRGRAPTPHLYRHGRNDEETDSDSSDDEVGPRPGPGRHMAGTGSRLGRRTIARGGPARRYRAQPRLSNRTLGSSGALRNQNRHWLSSAKSSSLDSAQKVTPIEAEFVVESSDDLKVQMLLTPSKSKTMPSAVSDRARKRTATPAEVIYVDDDDDNDNIIVLGTNLGTQH